MTEDLVVLVGQESKSFAERGAPEGEVVAVNCMVGGSTDKAEVGYVFVCFLVCLAGCILAWEEEVCDCLVQLWFKC